MPPPEAGLDHDDGEAALREAIAGARRALDALDGDSANLEAIQALLEAAVVLLAARLSDGKYSPAFATRDRPGLTDVALVVCAMLETADIDIPQLAMWQALGMGAQGTPRGAAKT